MGQLLNLFKSSINAPFILINLFINWLNLLDRASNTAIDAIDTELTEIQAAQQARAAALKAKAEQLAEARNKRATASAEARVDDILNDFK